MCLLSTPKEEDVALRQTLVAGLGAGLVVAGAYGAGNHAFYDLQRIQMPTRASGITPERDHF
ncbi:hypothetical protein [Accumulibacter sp.]|uniref:hypothetical protein n=1 Tax=Accumulibacter sp. TaxID=2053492 RepID=UPI0028C4F040|nr:hypothetical protein [Accumulibacter sp.]